eukprot:COSAG05_NODE_5138_length_1255_cov_0.975779_1_plen_74_part_00
MDGAGERGLLESTTTSSGTSKNRRKRSIWGKLVLERYKVQAEQLDEQAELQVRAIAAAVVAVVVVVVGGISHP